MVGAKLRFDVPGLRRPRCLRAAWLVTLAGLLVACKDTVDDGGPNEPAAEVVALGRMLFFDTGLSADGQIACASCHKPERAYSDGLARAVGVSGREGTRNTPSLLDVRRQHSLFWDGRRVRLEDQALDPLLSQVEHGLGDPEQLMARLRADARYTEAFRAAYGGSTGELTVQHVTRALAAFERTLVSGASPFERFLQGGRNAMSASAREGWLIFDQRAHCTRCHVVASGDGQPPLFTDHEFHSLAIGFSKIERKLPQLTERIVALRRDGGPLGKEVLIDRELAELGRFAVTLEPRHVASFKTPSLRNVALTAPYMHDGSVATLADAIDLEIYHRGARNDRPLILTPVERSDLVAFLEALTSDDVAPMPTSWR